MKIVKPFLNKRIIDKVNLLIKIKVCDENNEELKEILDEELLEIIDS